MSGLVNALNIGKTSLTTSQKAIEITGNNIANVNTPGYSRQSPVIAGHPSLNLKGFAVGQGVYVDQISREHDTFLDRELSNKNATLGEESGKAIPLEALERVFDISENGLAAEIDRFFDSWQNLSTNPGDVVSRNLVLQAGDSLTRAFQVTAEGIQQVRTNLDASLENKIDGINASLKEFASLNQRIANLEVRGQEALADRDRRDLLLQDISRSLGVKSLEAENGMASLFLPGGSPLVLDGQALELTGTFDPGGFTMEVQAETSTFKVGIDNLGGELRGMMNVREQTIPGLQSELDRLAHGLHTAVNSQHELGQGLDGVGGRAFFNPLGSQTDAASLLAVAVQDPSHVAAGRTSGPGDNTNALAIGGLGQNHLMDGKDTLSGFYAGLAGEVGLKVQQNTLTLGGTEDAMVQLQNLRDSRVGVSLEEEMINLLAYQKGFEASAKFLSTVDEMMDTLLTLKR